jgi:hypothetical protein
MENIRPALADFDVNLLKTRFFQPCRTSAGTQLSSLIL